jgi:hypothetical protein
MAARKSRAKRVYQEEEMSRRIECLERELENSKKREKFWREKALNHDETSSPPESTFQSKSDTSSNRISVSSLLENTSTGASEPPNYIPSSQVPRFKCPHPGCIAAPFKTQYKLM